MTETPEHILQIVPAVGWRARVDDGGTMQERDVACFALCYSDREADRRVRAVLIDQKGQQRFADEMPGFSAILGPTSVTAESA